MKNKIPTILTILICVFCLGENLYWHFHRDICPELFIRINIIAAFLFILIVLLPPTKQTLKKC